jgi:hypothetical protein
LRPTVLPGVPSGTVPEMWGGGVSFNA